CRVVQFRALPADEMVTFLMERYSLEHREAVLFARLSGGILGVAISYAISAAKKERRSEVLRVVQQLDRTDLARVSFMGEGFLREAKRSLDELKARQKRELDDLKKQMGNADIPSGVKKRVEQRHKREATHEEHQGFLDILSILVSWYRDIIMLSETGREDLLTNLDQVLLLKEHADRLTGADACRCLDVIEETRQYLRFNVNMQLAFETMLFKVRDIVAVREASLYP
ncbi:MAG: hypothetical protein HY779_02325, partial [Rubrobacteridae bacterium]|nr:hypothetical protein [Rubrobacteridae bacterium]